jgi:uncharacterized membrane protein YgdD (TMEM256/DUF423 family)
MTAGALLGALGVMLGAFGAHALKVRLEPAALATFETGVRYQLIHALALLALALLMAQRASPPLASAATCFLLGILFFSGSLYALATRLVVPEGGLRWFGLVTPLGGLLLIAGWVLLAVAAWRWR